MSWLTNIAWKIPRAGAVTLVALAFAASFSAAQELRVPDSAIAGQPATISITGSGHGTFYLTGPGTSIKRDVNLGEEIHLDPETLEHSGQYLAVVCSDSCGSANFFVRPSRPATLSFLVHPSRVPVNQPDAVSGVAFPFDHFGNLVLAPVSVDFQAIGAKQTLFSRVISTRDGVAWFRTASGKSAGPLHVTASIGALSSPRLIAQVASDPCNLRIKGQRTAKGIMVETEPVHDCAGNPVADGTIVTFNASGTGEKSTVDAPVKGDVARALITDSGPVSLSAASGVAMANEVHVGGK